MYYKPHTPQVLNPSHKPPGVSYPTPRVKLVLRCDISSGQAWSPSPHPHAWLQWLTMGPCQFGWITLLLSGLSCDYLCRGLGLPRHDLHMALPATCQLSFAGCSFLASNTHILCDQVQPRGQGDFWLTELSFPPVAPVWAPASTWHCPWPPFSLTKPGFIRRAEIASTFGAQLTALEPHPHSPPADEQAWLSVFCFRGWE